MGWWNKLPHAIKQMLWIHALSQSGSVQNYFASSSPIPWPETLPDMQNKMCRAYLELKDYFG